MTQTALGIAVRPMWEHAFSSACTDRASPFQNEPDGGYAQG
jgi:hypothetical protein